MFLPTPCKDDEWRYDKNYHAVKPVRPQAMQMPS